MHHGMHFSGLSTSLKSPIYFGHVVKFVRRTEKACYRGVGKKKKKEKKKWNKKVWINNTTAIEFSMCARMYVYIIYKYKYIYIYTEKTYRKSRNLVAFCGQNFWQVRSIRVHAYSYIPKRILYIFFLLPRVQSGAKLLLRLLNSKII